MFGGNYGRGMQAPWGGNDQGNLLGMATNLIAAALNQAQGPGPNMGGGMMGGPPDLMGGGSWRDQVNRGNQMRMGGGGRDMRFNRSGPNYGNRYRNDNRRNSNTPRNKRDDKSTPIKKKEDQASAKKTAEEKKEGGEAEKKEETTEESSKDDATHEHDEGDDDKAKKQDGPDREDTTEYAGLPKEMLKCLCCNKTMWDGISFRRHLNGRPHLQMMELMADEIGKKVDLMRQHIKLLEGRREIFLNKAKKNGRTMPDRKSYCQMCDLYIFGSLIAHRKTKAHQQLRKYLHPQCNICDKEFTVRTEWEEHKMEAGHMQKMIKAGDDYFDENEDLDIFPFFSKVNKKKDEDEKKEEGEEKTEKSDPHDPEAMTTEELAAFEIPEFKDDGAFGLCFVKPVNGFFCRLCKKFFATDQATHCQTKQHYDKFVDIMETKIKKAKATVAQTASAAQKRPPTDTEDVDDDTGNWKRSRTTKNEDDDEDSVDNNAEKTEVKEAETKDAE